LDLQTAKLASSYGLDEPAPARTEAARDETPQRADTVTAAETRPAEDWEQFIPGLGEQWSRQIQEQAEAGSDRLREQLRDLEHLVEESKQQLASLAEAKLAYLTQAVRDESGWQLSLAVQERTLLVREAADAGVKSIKQAAAETIAQFEAAEQKRETSYQHLAQTFQAQTQVMHEAADAHVKSIKKAAEEAIAQSQAAAQKNGAGILQALEAVEQLRGEVKNSGRFVEESKQQLASLAEEKLASVGQAAAFAVTSLEEAAAKLREEFGAWERTLAESRERLAGFAEAKIALLSRVASNAVVDLDPEQGRYRPQYAASRKEPEDPFTLRSAYQSATFDDNGVPSNRRGMTAVLAVGAGLFVLVTAQQLGGYLSSPPPPVQMHLQAEAPPDFADDGPSWSDKRRVEEEAMARDYWRAAAFSLPRLYPFGSQLPADPPPEFRVDDQYATTREAESVAKTRAHYWEKIRDCWGQRRFWIESQPVKETLADRLRGVWARN
jgi:hypothetical protein